jgi:hypothetical protein
MALKRVRLVKHRATAVCQKALEAGDPADRVTGQVLWVTDEQFQRLNTARSLGPWFEPCDEKAKDAPASEVGSAEEPIRRASERKDRPGASPK